VQETVSDEAHYIDVVLITRFTHSQSQDDICIAPLTILDSGAEQDEIM